MKTVLFKCFGIIILMIIAQGCVGYVPPPRPMAVTSAYPAYGGYYNNYGAYPAYGYGPTYYPPAVGIGIGPMFGFRGGWGHHHH
ncbi:hypothetical protein [Methylomonas sp. AM2-LC]|uniref:hypothetical protein n=1 Tax=Methylomonas sp. AM2-LC TaxID=3153301 RepID=UPI00326506BF